MKNYSDPAVWASFLREQGLATCDAPPPPAVFYRHVVPDGEPCVTWSLKRWVRLAPSARDAECQLLSSLLAPLTSSDLEEVRADSEALREREDAADHNAAQAIFEVLLATCSLS